MQCVNCEFENIPGMQICVRCQSSLNFGEVAVEPPRARRWRLWTRFERIGHGLRSAIPNPSNILNSLSRFRPTLFHPVSFGALVWSIIPGMGHIKEGHKVFGRALLSIWLILILLSLMTLGLGWSWWCLAAAIAVHTVAVTSLLGANLGYESIVIRAIFGILLFWCIQFLIYQPVQWFAGRFYQPLPVSGLQGSTVVANGDGLLFEGAWLRPDEFVKGALVVYEIRAGGDYQQGFVNAGLGLDRIVGVPGDHIEVTKGTLLVNHQPPKVGQEPLGSLFRPANFSYQLGVNEYAILPSQLRFNVHGAVQVDALVQAVSRVRLEQVLGRVVFRLHPWNRFGRID